MFPFPSFTPFHPSNPSFDAQVKCHLLWEVFLVLAGALWPWLSSHCARHTGTCILPATTVLPSPVGCGPREQQSTGLISSPSGTSVVRPEGPSVPEGSGLGGSRLQACASVGQLCRSRLIALSRGWGPWETHSLPGQGGSSTWCLQGNVTVAGGVAMTLHAMVRAVWGLWPGE